MDPLGENGITDFEQWLALWHGSSRSDVFLYYLVDGHNCHTHKSV